MYQPYCSCCYSTFDPNYEHQYEICDSMSTEESYVTSSELKNKPIRRSKHIPHHLRPKHIVDKRNTRERRRVHDVNQAFLVLKSLLPFDAHDHVKEQLQSTRISKVRTLRKAVDYIKALQMILNETNSNL
ncbi:hypothetical protein I4U23_019512 [Adineta vaga]|nr:hypothetical protein I4U23_019512 [Adineta vaga]